MTTSATETSVCSKEGSVDVVSQTWKWDYERNGRLMMMRIMYFVSCYIHRFGRDDWWEEQLLDSFQVT